MKKNNISAANEVLYRLNVNSEIETELLEEAFDEILSNPYLESRNVQLGSLLTGLTARGPSPEQVVTLLKSVFKLDNYSPYDKEKVELPNNAKLVGAVGSGKKGYKTINISTPALLIASTVGAYTLKPASSSTSSVTGSADLIRELGVNINISNEELKKVIRKTKFGVFSIENLIPKFDSIYSGRFYVPHALSFGLAALISPIEFDNLLYGLAHPDIELSACVLKQFKVENAMIVSSTDDNIHYLDEMGVYGTTRIIEIRNGNIGKLRYFNPIDELNLPHYTHKDISSANTIEENVQHCVNVLRGKDDAAKEDVICINSGTVLYLAGIAEDLREGYNLSKSTIKTGAPLEKLLEVINTTNGDKKALYKYLK